MLTARRNLPMFASRLMGSLRAGLRDAELLTAFALEQDADAFATLIARHGPLVWGVCRRTLRDTNDAEDAYQATFLILAREAGRLTCRDTLTGWLYSVAGRVASNLRRSLMRRQEHERRAAANRPNRSELPDTELGTVLDEELARLPDRLRNPLLLCYVQGKTHAEAADELKCPVSTLSDRLARGCEILRERLARRGLALGVGHVSLVLATALPLSAAPRMDRSLVEAAVSFVAGAPNSTMAAHLALEITRATIRAKLGLWALVLAALLGVAGTGAVAQRQAPPDRAETPSDARQRDTKTDVTRVDRFGDPIPEGALVRLGTLRFRPGRFLGDSAVALSLDARTIFSVVSADGQNEVQIWDRTSGKQVGTLPGPKMCVAIAVSPDGHQLVAAGAQEVWAWELTSEGPRSRWKQKPGGLGYHGVAFASDGRTVVCGGIGEKSIQLLDAATGELRCTIPGRGQKVSLSPDGRTLASSDCMQGQVSTRHQVCLWDVATGEKRHTLVCAPEKDGRVASFTFSADSKTLVTAATDRSIRSWEVATGQERRLADDAAPETFVAFEPGGRTLIEAGGEKIRFRDPATGRESRPAVSAPHLTANAGWGNGCLLSADGALFVSAYSTAIGVWEVRTGRPVGPSDVPVSWVDMVAFSHDGKQLVLGSRVGSQFMSQSYDSRNGQFLGEFRPSLDPSASLYPTQLGFSATQQIVVTGLAFTRPNKLVSLCAAGRVGEKPAPVFELPMPMLEKGGRGLVASPNGQLLLVGGEKGDVAIHDRDTGRVLRTFKVGDAGNILRFTDDGRYLIGFDMGGQAPVTKVTTWDVATGRQVGVSEIELKGDGLVVVAVSPDGRWLASGTTFKEPLRVWDLSSGKLSWQAAPTSLATSVRFSPDGRMLASGGEDGTVRIWEVFTGQERLWRSGHRSRVMSLAFSPDGFRLASGSADSTALIWDLKSSGSSLNNAKPDAVWSVLTGRDGAAAYRAILELAETPERAVPILRDRLRPRDPDAEQVKRLIRDLDDPEFAVREAASEKLGRLGDAIEPVLLKAINEETSQEVRTRLRPLLARLGPQSPSKLGAVRGVELLERMAADPAARQFLEELAKTPAELLLGKEARDACRRLASSESTANKP
jgi:RNA polymerase sigma factor (sigma-70 family)